MPLKIGELARDSKISVRTLHYYDEIGLVVPSLRDEMGHRLYSEADIERLQKVILLKSIAFSLDEIRRFLDDPNLSALQILELHRDLIKQELAERKQMLIKLDEITVRLKQRKQASGKDLLDILEGAAMLENQYNQPEYIEIIQKRILERCVRPVLSCLNPVAEMI